MQIGVEEEVLKDEWLGRAAGQEGLDMARKGGVQLNLRVRGERTAQAVRSHFRFGHRARTRFYGVCTRPTYCWSGALAGSGSRWRRAGCDG